MAYWGTWMLQLFYKLMVANDRSARGAIQQNILH